MPTTTPDASPALLPPSNLLEALLEQTPLGFAQFDLALRFVRINEVLARINGVPVEAHLGRTVEEVVPELEPVARELTDELRRTGCPLSKEITGVTPAQPGVTRSWLEHWFPLCDERENTVGYGVLIEETTERRESNRARESLIAALRTSEERLHFALATGGVAIWEYDPVADRTVWTGDTHEIYGLPHDAMPTANAEYWTLLHPDDAEGTIEQFSAAMAANREYHSDFRVYWPDGSVHWVHGRARFLRNAEGQVVRVTGINTNVTERYAAAQALRDSEERLRLSMEAAYLIGFSWDIARDEVHRLHSLSDALPATGSTAPVHFADVQARVHPDDRELFAERVRRCLEDSNSYENEFRVVEDDGSVRWLYERGVVTRAEDGTPLILSGLSQDITARKAAEQALQVANRRKDEFLATLAHELRNPLAPIRSATEVLRLLGSENPTVNRAVDIIDRQVNQMVRLVDDLLDVNRITRGDITLLQEPVDIAKAVQVAVETSRPVIEAGRHELQLSLPFSPIMVLGDAARLSQALSNLLNNAARYTPSGGRIDLQVMRDNGQVRISVADTGRGIPADKLGDIFDMFTRVAPDAAQGGLGIGLALVRRIVELHGGEVRALSDGAGQGSTFEIWLPVHASTGEAPAVATPATPVVVTPDTGLRILIVDDNVDFATSEATMLELKHHIVCVVHDAQAALDVVPVFSPDVALLDIGLPGMDGFELARRLREDPANADLVLVAQTGWGQPADKKRALLEGFDAHLTKPVAWPTLESVLNSVYESRPKG
jgi:PAS domain S-box-containing protein